MERLSLQNNYVYHLVDSSTGKPFYVGKGHGNRMYEHESKVRRSIVPNQNLHLFYKIKKLISNEILIEYYKVADGLSERDALNLEISEIQRIGRKHLCNLTNGGEGMSGFRHSEITKNIMSEKRKAWFVDPSHRQKTSETTRKGMLLSGWADRMSKEIVLVSPNGEIVIAKNIAKFCRDNNLQNANVYKVLRGEIKTHRGWKVPSK